jgi:arabinogalactan endo-1,4-beta-galactosidase
LFRVLSKGGRVHFLNSLLTLHRDWWADPTKQYPPASWPKTLGPLAKTIRKYVSSTLVSFNDAGINLDIVSLGNEIRHGFLWPLGHVDVNVQPWSALVDSFSDLATLFNAARAGVDDAVSAGVSKPQVMIHIDDGWNQTLQERWFGALVASGVPKTAWDVFGFSFYPFYGTSATLRNLQTTLHKLATDYGKPLQVVETDYPAICTGNATSVPKSSEPEIPYDIEGQIEWTHDIISVVKGVPHGLGTGVHYWEPAWLNNTGLGSACEDAILFSPDYSGWPAIVGYSRSSVNLFKC